MNNCVIRGCLKLKHVCEECGRTVCNKDLGPRWTSVKDQPPPDKCDFLGTDGELIFAAYWCDDTDSYKVGGWESCNYCGGASNVSLTKEDYTTKKITHWMPLPNPPKEK